ncbi:MAG TPA: enoyl-CoA hydratase/isomerase family protein [Leptospiraceae bacterium]|nr:enoyl-CoA hydratase/isomerase family protein [Leptospiraceae bacterium]HMY66180.1 enoyl-CoA hydratase/isomerase family protein [Leptospiraceae bacterium]HNF14001.1 enoyl-CoA hydratase/isomerase family protein [Leptospiraceae bacterium]HNF22932.1 enoyl-CoA hydratase/isomerase family protein [Leptospiraceae bacterium]HNH07057.1 enoyl-CoA hydratase/isomerase family protein [Leptospiraceae bacterium]
MIREERNDYIAELYVKTNEFNSFGKEFFLELRDLLKKLSLDRKVKAVIFSSDNEKYFSKGFNPEFFIGKSREEIFEGVSLAVNVSHEALFFSKPVIAAVNGHAFGVGAVLALYSDYKIMIQKKPRISFPESLIGLNFPGVTAYVLTQSVGLKTARELLYTGKMVKAEEAMNIGLIDETALDEKDLLERARKYCRTFKDMAMESVTGLKSGILEQVRHFASVNLERDIQGLSDAVSSSNGQEGLRSIHENRRPVFK